MSQYILRLDDASDYMDVKKWQRMEELLDQYGIKPLVGVIPDNRDSSLTDTYEQDPEFWDKTARWKEKGWELALHGCYHKYPTGLLRYKVKSIFKVHIICNCIADNSNIGFFLQSHQCIFIKCM